MLTFAALPSLTPVGTKWDRTGSDPPNSKLGAPNTEIFHLQACNEHEEFIIIRECSFISLSQGNPGKPFRSKQKPQPTALQNHLGTALLRMRPGSGPLTHVYYVSNEHFTGAFVRRDAGARAVKEPFFASQAVSSLSLVRIHLGCSSSLPVLTLAWFP